MRGYKDMRGNKRSALLVWSRAQQWSEIWGRERTGKVEGYTEWCTEFVVACVTLPDTGIAVVHARRHTSFTELCS